MDFLLFALVGLSGGLLGGMGMGGGTVLIPLLSIFMSVGQHSAQSVNLVSFIPMAIVSLVLHLKNKLIVFKDLLWIIIPGVLLCVLGCFLARGISGNLLKRIFGGFLIVLSVFQFVMGLKAENIKNDNDKKSK